MGNTYHARNIVSSLLLMIWALRLGGKLNFFQDYLVVFRTFDLTKYPAIGFLLFRVLKTGSDTRFDDIRAHFVKFMGFWVGQMIWVRVGLELEGRPCDAIPCLQLIIVLS